ncbi:O-antigen ligase family protein [Niveispirillum lacus]|nr:O-antigen ligase family protein [Niveispirillum lacus]
MMAMTFLIRDLFTTNETTLRPGFAKGLRAIHYILCGYAMLAWLVLHGADIDISLFVSEQESLYVFSVVRTSGLQREPAWAGYALASSYLAVLATRPQRMLLVQLAFLGGIAATGSGVGVILASLFITHQMLTMGKGGLAVRLTFLAGMAVVMATIFSDRIGNVLNQNDPSTQMRLESSFVALDVIAETFPVGTGFGNYQEHADFDPVIWSGFLNLDEAAYYKSDTLILNLIAELGVFGCVLLIAFMGNFICRTAPLVGATALIMMLSSGTMIIPFYLVLAAICGLERGRMARLAAGQKETRT